MGVAKRGGVAGMWGHSALGVEDWMPVTATEKDLIDAAGAGDEDAFARLVAGHRNDLHAHCYRMLGSTGDAEDALQETLVSAWRGLSGFEGRSSVRTWLYRIATNACLKAIQRRPVRLLPVDYGPAAVDPHDDLGTPLAETVWIEPYPTVEGIYEAREDIELAFVAALQHLPAAQRAVLILRDVLGFSGHETADILGLTATAVYSSLQRAHRTVASKQPSVSQQATIRSLGDQEVASIAGRYVDAWERGDVETIVGMLTEDAAFTMPPYRTWFRGREAIAEFLATRPLSGELRHGWRFVATRANGQLAFASYLWDDEREAYAAHSLSVLTLRGSLIAEVTAFLTDTSFPELGLPARIDR